MTVTEAKGWLEEGQFPAGSMGPKIEAAVEFIERGGKEVIIAGERMVVEALNHGKCTRIIADE
jgi:carbamate kinase